MPITLFHIRHAGLHVRRFRDLHPPASRCGICLRRCSPDFHRPAFFHPTAFRPAVVRLVLSEKRRNRIPQHAPSYCGCLSLPERSSKIALFVSFCVSAFSLLLPSAHSACCQAKSLDSSLSIYTIFPLLSNTPLLFFRSMYGKPTPIFFPYPLWIRPSNGCTCRRCMQLCRSYSTTRPSRIAMQSEYLRGFMAVKILLYTLW